MEDQELALLKEKQVDLVVLARYMQIITDEFCAATRAASSTSTTVPAGLHRVEAASSGARARRQARRRDGALRDGRPRRRPDHRAGLRAHLDNAIGRVLVRRRIRILWGSRRRRGGVSARRRGPDSAKRVVFESARPDGRRSRAASRTGCRDDGDLRRLPASIVPSRRLRVPPDVRDHRLRSILPVPMSCVIVESLIHFRL